jgi:hypothetical protein
MLNVSVPPYTLTGLLMQRRAGWPSAPVRVTVLLCVSECADSDAASPKMSVSSCWARTATQHADNSIVCNVRRNLTAPI